MDFLEEKCFVESDAVTYDSDDTQDDPNFDILEEAKSKFSNLSIRKKTRRRISNDIDKNDGEEPDAIGIDEPELDGADQKSYESVQNIIQAGEIERLKVDQCKLYLRKHGLRLTGNKAMLIERIKEHIDVVNGDGEKKYPVSSFVLNCKGDACTGDVVLFEQNVYEMFSIVSRSASGPPCGTRVVAGRIVKESYGMAKQQHTFTIEVLWSKGEKPLPALHPLLIKGRNLYRLKTLRQRWEDEGQRQKILFDKHARGSVARIKREARIEEREMRMQLKLKREMKKECQKQAPVKSKEQRRHMPSVNLEKLGNRHQKNRNDTKLTEPVQKINQNECKMNVTTKPLCVVPSFDDVATMPSHDRLHQRQPLTDANVMNGSRIPYRGHINGQPLTNVNVNTSGLPGNTPSENTYSNFPVHPATWYGYDGNRNHSNQTSANSQPTLHNINFNHGTAPARVQGHEKKLPCRYYAQGRCYFGHNCKYLH